VTRLEDPVEWNAGSLGHFSNCVGAAFERTENNLVLNDQGGTEEADRSSVTGNVGRAPPGSLVQIL
jgi:hypothetical protein